MRLIDADMFVEEAKPLTGVPIKRIKNAPTIDTETLPVVQELRRSNEMLKAVVKTLIERSRAKTSEINELCEKVSVLDEKLHRVTAQKDAAMRGELVESIKLCLEKSPDKNTVYVPRTLLEKLAFVMQEDGKDG